ncbi:hypothetical protein [Halosimplex halobium]|uniref:hypothetical protein n=1 Tax=Halosimplex halobium TaxID=3396618 RepID=UPI003F55673A
MTLYREGFRFSIPLTVVEETFTQQYGEPEAGPGGNDYTWPVHSGLVYRYAVTLDRDTGLCTARVSTMLPYRSFATIVPLLSLCLYFVVDIAGLLALSVACIGLGMLPLTPMIPWVPLSGVDLEYEVVVEERAVTQYGLAPVLTSFALLISIFESLLFKAQIAIFGCLAVAVYSYQSGLFRGMFSDQFTIVALPITALAPLVVTVGNLYLLVLVSQLPLSLSTVLVVGLCVSTLLFLWLFTITCRRGIDVIEAVSIRPLRSPVSRLLWLSIFTGTTFVLLASFVFSLLLLLPASIELPYWIPSLSSTVSTAEIPVPNAPDPIRRLWVWSVFLMLVSPTILLGLVWVSSTSSRLYSRIRLLRSMTRFPKGKLGFDPGVPVYSVQSSGQFAYALQIPGIESGILLGSETIEGLETDELQAVCAHELHHLERNDAKTIFLSMLAGILLGGQNVLLAFYDLPQMEAAADRYAAQKIGLDPTIRALRKMETLSQPAAPMGQRPDGLPGFQIRSTGRSGLLPKSTLLSQLLSDVQSGLQAPEELLYGDALVTAAHRSVDERIRELAANE